MIRTGILSLALACPAALAQETDLDGRRLADAFTATDLETLGACQARVEGMDRLAREFSPWYASLGDVGKVESLRKGQEQALPLVDRMATLRAGAADLTGISPEASDAARANMLALFARRDGEDNAAAYARWQPETLLPQACRDAMKRARWKLELDGGAN